jgi:septum site-determining protein MinC
MAHTSPLTGRTVTEAAFDLRSERVQAMVLTIRHLDLLQLQEELAEHIAQAPALLRGAPVVLALNPLSQLADHGLLAELVRRIGQAGLVVIGLAAQPGMEAAARSLGLPLIAPERRRAVETVVLPTAEEAVAESPGDDSEAESAEGDEADETPSAPPAPPAPQPPLVLPGPIRSGQQVYARGRDLIITGTVSAGAEVAADGCVHVYGRLSGKAHAGAAGDLRARVYCLVFGAELVSIAGHFKVYEAAPREVAGKAVEISLNDGRIDVRPLQN